MDRSACTVLTWPEAGHGSLCVDIGPGFYVYTLMFNKGHGPNYALERSVRGFSGAAGARTIIAPAALAAFAARSTRTLDRMSYEAADPIIEPWGRENSVTWFRQYRDEEVRSAEVYLASGRCAQLWLEPQKESATFAVCAWDRESRRFRELASLRELRSTLDRALADIRSWSKSAHAV